MYGLGCKTLDINHILPSPLHKKKKRRLKKRESRRENKESKVGKGGDGGRYDYL